MEVYVAPLVRGLERAQQRALVSRHRLLGRVRACSGQRGVVAVAHDHQQRRAEPGHRELYAGERFLGHHVSREAHDEQLAQARVEHDLGRDARVGVGDDDRERLLHRRERVSVALAEVGPRAPLAEEAAVARAEQAQGDVRRQARRRFASEYGLVGGGLDRQRALRQQLDLPRGVVARCLDLQAAGCCGVAQHRAAAQAVQRRRLRVLVLGLF